MKIGVTGATGQLGRMVVDKLKEKVSADSVVALVRNPEKAAGMGVEVRSFDYNQSENLALSLQGIDKLLLISSNEIGQRAKQHANIIHAAKQAGVQWIVYTSLLHADKSTLSLAGEHLATEEALKESGIPYTLLRNGWYTEIIPRPSLEPLPQEHLWEVPATVRFHQLHVWILLKRRPLY